MNNELRASLKAAAFWAASAAVAPLLVTHWIRSRLLGSDRALEGSTQLLALVPGLAGQYLRRAFLVRVVRSFHRSATIAFGTILASADVRIGENVYVGPNCHLGSVHLEPDVLLGAGVHVPSGSQIHGSDDLSRPIREQPGSLRTVRVGRGSWIGSAAVVMADVGCDSIVAAGAVVTKPVPDRVVAGGVPARVLRSREESRSRTA